MWNSLKNPQTLPKNVIKLIPAENLMFITKITSLDIFEKFYFLEVIFGSDFLI